jgi:hypothetical protein
MLTDLSGQSVNTLAIIGPEGDGHDAILQKGGNHSNATQKTAVRTSRPIGLQLVTWACHGHCLVNTSNTYYCQVVRLQKRWADQIARMTRVRNAYRFWLEKLK